MGILVRAPADVVKVEGVELSFYRDGEAIVVHSTGGQARIARSHDRYRYVAGKGDPLELLGIVDQLREEAKLDADGFVGDADWFAATADHTYPDPPQRVIGQAGCLDIARYRTFIGMELGVSVEDIDALLMGGHGDDMVPLPRYTSVAGIPVTQLIKKERLDEIIQRAKMGGGEIVKLMGTSAYYAPAAGTIQMVEAIVRDKKRILPCAAYCDSEYGVGGCFVGVPCVLGAGGVERIIEVELDGGERQLFDSSVAHVKELCELAERVLNG